MVNTNWTDRITTNTSRGDRTEVDTDRGIRKSMIIYYTELRDANNIVCNENGNIIYIYANEGTPISVTHWIPRE